MEHLTEKQEAVFKFIEEYQLAEGKSPTLREMRENFGVSSDNSILKHIKALKEKGFIEKDDTPRGIKLLSSVRERFEAPSGIRLPLLGSIPAGGPVLSEEYIDSWMSVGEDIASNSKDYFLLKVTGDSMIDAGIFEGDIVVVDMKKEARKGHIVVALVDGGNTIKRFVEQKGKFYLKAENPDYSDIYAENELEIQGVVTSLIRQY
ncbi:transcriptional repressor LexA [Candidatus Gracilibacteria bacterium]|nr:transcriptional repressor LexA [Candidatus Gracilibacteria bacterium]